MGLASETVFSNVIESVEKEFGSKSSGASAPAACPGLIGGSWIFGGRSPTSSKAFNAESGDIDGPRPVLRELAEPSSGLAIRRPPSDCERLRSPSIV